MIHVYLVRHGESTGNAENRWTGQDDHALSPRGEEQAREAGAALQDQGLEFRCVTSSSLTRARQTAEILARTLQRPLRSPIAELIEIDIGAVAGLTSPEMEVHYPEALGRWHAGLPVDFPEGEAWPDFARRVEAGLQGLAQLGESPTLAVVHEGVLRVVSHLLGEPVKNRKNLEGRWIAISDGRIKASAGPGGWRNQSPEQLSANN